MEFKYLIIFLLFFNTINAQDSDIKIVKNDLFFNEELYKSLRFDHKETDGKFLGLTGKVSYETVCKKALEAFLNKAKQLNIKESEITIAILEGRFNPFYGFIDKYTKANDLQLVWKGLASEKDIGIEDLNLIPPRTLEMWKQWGDVDANLKPVSQLAIIQLLELKRNKIWNERFGDLNLNHKKVKSIFNEKEEYITGEDLAARRLADNYFIKKRAITNKPIDLKGFPKTTDFMYRDIMNFLKSDIEAQKKMDKSIDYYISKSCLYNYFEYHHDDYQKLRTDFYLPAINNLPSGVSTLSQFENKKITLEAEERYYNSLSYKDKKKYDMKMAIKDISIQNSQTNYIYQNKDYWIESWASMTLPEMRFRQIYVDIPIVRLIAKGKGKELNTEEENIKLNMGSLVLFFRTLNERGFLKNNYSRSDANDLIRAFYMEYVVNYCSLCEFTRPEGSKEFNFMSEGKTTSLYVHPKYLDEYEKYLSDGYSENKKIDAYGVSEKSGLNYHVGFESVRTLIKQIIRTEGCQKRDVLEMGNVLLHLSQTY